MAERRPLLPFDTTKQANPAERLSSRGGMKPEEVVRRLLEQKIIASTTPYRVSYARLACGIVNTPEEVEKALGAIRRLA